MALSVVVWVVQVQDEAAGLVVALLDPQPGETILDACAAPGGKALYAASRMQGQVSCCPAALLPFHATATVSCPFSEPLLQLAWSIIYARP